MIIFRKGYIIVEWKAPPQKRGNPQKCPQSSWEAKEAPSMWSSNSVELGQIFLFFT